MAAPINLGHDITFNSGAQLSSNVARILRDGNIVAIRASGVYKAVLGIEPQERPLEERAILYIDYTGMPNLDFPAFRAQITAECGDAVEIADEAARRLITTEAVHKKVILPLGNPRWNPCKSCTVL